MTFEEFFAKKKIDLAALQKADQSLYEEFKKHYVAMGAKSFDHTKKFWFNRLRKSYHLAETIVEKKEVQPASEKEQQSVKAEASPATTTATGFKPRFKAPVTAKDSIPQELENPERTLEKANESTTTKEDIAKPAGFKPRFKAGVTKPATTAQDTTPVGHQAEAQADPTDASNNAAQETATDLPTEPSSKPAGFKPRFKAGVTKPAAAAQDTTPVGQQAEAQADPTAASNTAAQATAADLSTEPSSKPAGFKPRFKAGVTKPATAAQDTTPVGQQAEAQADPTDASNTAAQATSANLPTEPSSKPAGFKPRFKDGVTKPATAAQDTTLVGQQAEAQPDPTAASNNAAQATAADLPTEPSSKPAGFKPRFKVGVTKPVTAAQDITPVGQQAEAQADPTDVSNTAAQATAADLPTEPSSKPAGFKPRFKAGVTKPATAAQDTTPVGQQAEAQPDPTDASNTAAQETAADLPTEPSSKPAGFKPRFKAGVTKLKNKDTD
ncbi:hypothetical protein [Sphingobacterium faecium]|uniref:hypothetical protein n=1 Tax=Sphingobacterium faecium TaxID=34087 RepID=UPI0024791CC5|nr:hypothetical protein [Sphingobacterium faecium]WGQ12682.1 hypothetical protein QG727_11655 [Sphingobacterium faecium]